MRKKVSLAGWLIAAIALDSFFTVSTYGKDPSPIRKHPSHIKDPASKTRVDSRNLHLAQREVEIPTPVGPEPVVPETSDTDQDPSSSPRLLPKQEEDNGDTLPTPVQPQTEPQGSGELLSPPPSQPANSSESARPKSEKPVVGEVEAVLLQRGGILLPPGYLQIQPSIEFSHFSTSRFAVSGLTLFQAIIIGQIQVDELKREILTSSLTARYGLFDRLQVGVRVPYVYRRDQEIFQIGTTQQQSRVTSNNNLGDIEAEVDYQPIIGRGNIPNVVLRFRGKTRTGKDAFDIPTVQTQGGRTSLEKPPTGTGFYSFSPGVNLVWRSDPLVLFTGANYSFNFARNVGGNFGSIDPGDSVDFNFGFNLAASERIGINMFFSNSFTFESSQNGVDTVGSEFNDARLAVGSSISINPTMTFLVSGSVGLTNESPDYVFTLSLPFTTQLF